MKRILAFALTVMMLFGIMCIAPVSTSAAEVPYGAGEDTTVYFVDYPDSFKAVYAYAWTETDGTVDAAEEWPGKEMSFTGEVLSENNMFAGGPVYSVTFDKEYENIVFFCELVDESTTQTADLTFEAGKYLFWGNEVWYDSIADIEAEFYAADDTPVTGDEYTVYFVDTACFETAYAYAWNSDDDYNDAWPGVEMTLTNLVAPGGSPVYSYTTDKWYDYIVFSDGAGMQTSDLNFEPNQFLYWNDDCWYESLEDIPAEAPESDYMTIYFQNNWMWTDVSIYFWDSALEESAQWPGAPMDYYDNDGTYDIYCAEIPTDVGGFLIAGVKDDGSGAIDQTPDIKEGYYDGICYYMLWDNGNVVGNEDISVILPDTGDDGGEDEPEECEHTFNSNGVCVRCGVLEEGVLAGVAGYSLSLGGNIGVYQYVAISEEILNDETACVVLTLPRAGSTYELVIPVNELELNGKFFKVMCEVAAKELSCEINMVVKTDSIEIDLGSFAAKDYCYSAVNSVVLSDEVKAVAKALLNYATAAQLYFDYNTDNLANKDLSAEDKVVATADLSAYAPVVEGEAGNVEYYGASLTLNTETSINFYFRIYNPVSDRMAITVNGLAGAPLEKNGNLYQFTDKNISAHMLGTSYVLETGSQTITYSPLSYAYLAQQSSKQELVDVANALFAYYDAVSLFA